MQVLIYDGGCSMCSSLIQKMVKSCRNDALRITDFHSTHGHRNMWSWMKVWTACTILSMDALIYTLTQ